jgi:uracil-DNA glycosylase
MYHPAAALHQAALRGAIEDDFKKLPKWLAEAERDREVAEEAVEPPPSQMSMF